jgi:hypothetical protein
LSGLAGKYLASTRRSKGLRRSLSIFFFSFVLLCIVSNVLSQDLDSISQTLRSGTVEQKRSALMAIRSARSEAASRIAIPALSDANDMVRATAASSIVFLPKVEAAGLLTRMFGDKAEFVRKSAAYALSEVGDAATMLGEENESTNADALWLLVSNDKSFEVRSAAVIAMGKVGGFASVKRLVELLEKKNDTTDEGLFLRRSAIRSIGKVAEDTRSGKRTIPSLSRGTSPEDFRSMDYSEEFRSFASAAKILIGSLQNDKEDSDVRRESAAALGKMGVLSSKPALTACLAAEDPYLAANCRNALEKLKNIKTL